MDRRTLLAMLLCMGIFLGWQKFYIEPRMPKAGPVAEAPATTAPGATTAVTQTGAAVGTPPTAMISGSATPGAPAAATILPESKLVQLASGTALVGNGSKIFTGWDLKSYKLGIQPEAAAVDVKSITQQDGQGELAFDSPEYAYITNVRGKLETTPTGGLLWTYEDANLKLTREVAPVGNKPFVDLKINAEFKGKKPNYAFVSLASQSFEKDPEVRDRQLLYWTNESVERVSLKDAPTLKEVSTDVKWIGASSRYFLMALINNGPIVARGLIQPTVVQGGRVSLAFPVAGNQLSLPLKAYFGPKELDTLRSVDPTLDHTVDFGWFTVLAYPLLRIMKWFYGVVQNWGIAIILLTIVVRMAVFPLAYKSAKSMKVMSKLQPQLTKLREKYKNDKETLNREMMGLMRTQGYNPVAGCLPIVIQMPVFFALYRVLYSSIELYHAPFGMWIHDLSDHDPLYVTPVLMAVTMFLQQRLTPNTAADPTQQKMLQFMPLMFGAFMLTLPSGLTLYMLVSAIVGILQQVYLNKKFQMKHDAIVPAIGTSKS